MPPPSLLVPLDPTTPLPHLLGIEDLLRGTDLSGIAKLPHADLLLRAVVLQSLLAKTVEKCPTVDDDTGQPAPIMALVASLYIPGDSGFTGSFIGARGDHLEDLLAALLVHIPAPILHNAILKSQIIRERMDDPRRN